MDSLFTQNAFEDLEDIPQTEEPVWILGRRYNAMKGNTVIKQVQIVNKVPLNG